MAKLDIEMVMDDVQAIVKANLPTFIAEKNAEKGDDLLIDFNEKAYYMYTLPGIGTMPPYKVAFMQSIESLSTLDPIHCDSAIGIKIALDVMVSSNSDNAHTDERRLIRYLSVIKGIVEKKVSPRYPSMVISGTDVIWGNDKNAQVWGIAQVCVSVAI